MTETVNTTDSDLTAADIGWDVEPLLDGGTVDAMLASAAEHAAVIKGYRGRIGSLDAAEMATLMGEVAVVQELLSRVGNYASLRFSVDTADPAVGALMAKVDEQGTAIGNDLVFVELEWAEVPDERVEELLADPQLAFCAHHLRSALIMRPHLLAEGEEKIMADKSITGRGAWVRLFSELDAAITAEIDGESVPLESALSLLASNDRDVRRNAQQAITDALQPGIRTRGFVFNTVLADAAVDDRIRKFPTWVSSRNLSNEASDESVQALVDAVVNRYDIPQRWYALKARLLGIDRLADYDRMAAVAASDEQFGWAQAEEIVLGSYASFSPELADAGKRFFDEGWIDAPMRPGKRPGAFCAYTVPSHHPYLLLNWTAKRRDVLTLAHELGHGLHAYLARDQGIFHQTTPLTLAETASVFGETVTFGRLLQETTDPDARLALLAESLEGAIATVFRQIAMNRFEAAVHTERREVGELSIERFGELWFDSQSAMLGDSVEVTDNYRSWWSYIPHFIHTPGYVYAYAYGQLLALSVYRKYEEQGADFVPAYLELLAAGGSKSPQDLGAIVGVDLADPSFWDGGLEIIEKQLEAAEAAAKAAGRL